MTVVTPEVFVASVAFTILWGISLAEAIAEYLHAKNDRRHYPKAFIRALRAVVFTLVLTATSAAYLLRTVLVLAGEDGNTAGLVAFFALLCTNFVGGLFCAVSLRYD